MALRLITTETPAKDKTKAKGRGQVKTDTAVGDPDNNATDVIPRNAEQGPKQFARVDKYVWKSDAGEPHCFNNILWMLPAMFANITMIT